MGRPAHRIRVAKKVWGSALVGALAATFVVGLSGSATAGPCDPPNNAIVCENSLDGTPKDEWWIESPYGDIEGFATATSVQPGEQLNFKIKTPSNNYKVEILRLGYYRNGEGARRITTLNPIVSLPQSQPFCAYDGNVGLVDCGNWAVSARWNVPSTQIPGFYIANFIREDGEAGASQYPFVVRSDSSTSDIVVQTSDQTWQAYNKYGDRPNVNEFNLYEGGFSGSSDGRAYKVSYNRPYRNGGTANFLNAEYPLVRWLEKNGYNVSYLSGVDVTRNPALVRNHKVYVSSGHDEYVNAAQRTGIEQARAAGVNMMFMSGNEWFWKTRFENSIDPSHTPYRTLVCYKETKVVPLQKLDPSSEWTGTWRDARLSPPSDGGRPENAITGTLFMVNGYRADAIQVPAAYGKMRFWRDTPLATATTTTTLPVGTLGYEWNVDPDNNYRPPGAVPLSETTVTVDDGQLLLDNGHFYGGGPATHKMVLYRDQTSRALVWGAGTVQWSWGLDGDHLYPYGAPTTTPTSQAMQQATVNVLADMNVQPQNLRSPLTLATRSTDTTGPVVTVTNPAANSTVPAGTQHTISGTAVDSGGGKVGAVEISLDGGTTWRRANGTSTWTYPWTPANLGPASIKVRASDDNANLGATTTVNLTVGAQQCPCTVFGNQTPSTVDSGDTSAIELGMKIKTSVNANVTGVRFYKSSANTGTHTGSLWNSSGQRLATGTFSGESASGWQTLNFAQPVGIRAGQTYIVSYSTTTGHYAFTAGYFNGKGAGVVPVTAPSAESSGGNGVFRYGAGFPDSTFNGGNYWVDAVVTTDGADNNPPTVTSSNPAVNGTGAYTDQDVAVTFSEPVDPSSVTFTLTQGSTQVPGAASTNDNIVRFTPTNLLLPNTSYTATINATDGFGNALAQPRTWNFTTGAGPAPCPCTVFGQAVPNNTDTNDPSDVELGMKFTSSTNAVVTGVRYYKSAANTGTHTGSLYAANGTRLATGTFVNETATGWQTLTFAQGVQIQAGKTYVVSYRTPTGHYAADGGYFANKGAGRGVVTAPTSAAAGGQGVFQYGGGFPSNSYNDTNYWVDPVVVTDGADTSPPTVTNRDPQANATDVPTGNGVTATFNEPVDAESVSLTVKVTGGATVAGTTRVTPDGRSVSFAPNADLAGNTSYTVTVSATDLQGNSMPAPHTWTFTTGAAGACPCTLFRSVDAPAVTAIDSPVELGTRITPSANGSITGVRFYKSVGDTGTHTGTLWSSTGQVLATGTFSNETGSGWQTLTFSSPVAVTAGTTYVVSFHTSAGYYGYTTGYFNENRTRGPLTAPAHTGSAPNGVYRYGSGGVVPGDSGGGTNYWVDAVFDN
ncbi:DUF4082 domain-containing protein [Lentzea sp. HUAS12]|uniref:DUF4082 domain-containing protein n=1 Tax=Lentzea sp. HUAS12 TaxID=2951806 RepID=UPI0020A05128|nr:DUF4082 domain-containing protein [Lentzea sp. HUAS12]USX55954.1 DUF4082 domain-containing protein [Lentzea sp. HUAS12]